ncbi:MAG TPA: DinB family protein [Pyrinomonadaceae bacterium]|jgi:uncharacterized damage-inducible protein DinB
MMNVKDARELFEYDEWANGLVLDAAARLSDGEFTRGLGNSFPSVRDTLVHLLHAEWVWLRRWRGESPRVVLDPAEFPDVASVGARLAAVARERAGLVAGLSDDDLGRVVAYTNAKGEEWRYPLGRMMQHVVNHSTYHRGQIVTMLRQLGAGAPSTDLLYYDDSLAAREP